MYTILSQKTVFTGNIFSIIHHEVDVGDGRIKIFEKAARSPGVRLIIVNSSQQRILLTREYRHELGRRDIRLPGGKIFDHQSDYSGFVQDGGDIQEIVIQAAQKEAQEEVGIMSGDFSFFKKSILGSTVEWDLYFIIVSNSIFENAKLESGEYITSDWYSFDEAKKLCLDGVVFEERGAMVLMQYLYSFSLSST